MADGGESAALLIVARSGGDPDLARFVGGAHLGASFLVMPAGGAPRLGYLTAMERDEARATGLELLDPESLGVVELLREAAGEEELWRRLVGRALRRLEIPPGPIDLAGSPPAGVVAELVPALAELGFRARSGRARLLALRKRKSAAEAAEARRVAAAATEALRRIAALLAAAESGAGGLVLDGRPLTAGRLRREAAACFAEHGLEQPHGNIVAAGADAGVPHTQGDSGRVLRAGESLVVDLFPRGRLYADCTRTFCVGSPPESLAAAHALVLEVLEAARARAAAGVAAESLQKLACERFAAAGHATPLSDPGTVRGYVHGLGHGVGYELHELPSFRPDRGAAGRLDAGDLFTLEPGLYEPEAGWGVRIEDLYRLGREGLERLTPAPYALDPRAWPRS